MMCTFSFVVKTTVFAARMPVFARLLRPILAWSASDPTDISAVVAAALSSDAISAFKP